MVDIESIRQLVSERGFRITGHASVEAVKDGISPADIRYVIFNGKIMDCFAETKAQ